jgi:hypothetical protein
MRCRAMSNELHTDCYGAFRPQGSEMHVISFDGNRMPVVMSVGMSSLISSLYPVWLKCRQKR